MASSSNNLAVVECMVHECMANPDTVVAEGAYAALHYAIVKDNLEVIEWLVDNSTCNLDLPVKFVTPPSSSLLLPPSLPPILLCMKRLPQNGTCNLDVMHTYAGRSTEKCALLRGFCR
jgi:hypothetical protein